MPNEHDRREDNAAPTPQPGGAGAANENAGEDVGEAVARLQAAVKAHQAPSVKDVDLVQKHLGNKMVHEILSADEDELPVAPGVAAKGDYKIVLYARHRFALGQLDTGHAWIGLEGPGAGDGVYGFHPQRERDVAGPGEVRDNDTITGGTRMQEFAITKVQFEAAKARAEKIKASPPGYNLFRHNCVDFVMEVASAGGVKLPRSSLLGISDPEGMADKIDDKIKEGEKPAANPRGGQ